MNEFIKPKDLGEYYYRCVMEHNSPNKDLESALLFYINHAVFNKSKFTFLEVTLRQTILNYCFLYARNVIKGRWRESEALFVTSITDLEGYCKYFNVPLINVQDDQIEKNNFIITKIDFLHPELKQKYYHLLVGKDIGIL